MKYVYSYEVAALLIVWIIQFFFYTRRPARTRSNIWFAGLGVITALVCITDLISCLTISFPANYPMWFTHYSAAAYTYTYACWPMVFLIYADMITKIPSLRKPVKIVSITYIVYQNVLFLVSRFNHLYIYFDENLEYRHGSLFYLNYVLGIGALVVGFSLLAFGRVKFSIYQKSSVLIMCIPEVLSITVQMLRPELLLGGLNAALMYMILYIVFENPAYYFYRGTKCQNSQSFFRYVKECKKLGRPTTKVIVRIRDYSMTISNLTSTQVENLTRDLADKISNAYSGKAYMINESTYAVVLSEDASGEETKKIEDGLLKIFNDVIDVAQRIVKLRSRTIIIPPEIEFTSSDELLITIETLISAGVDLGENAIAELSNTAINKLRRKRLVNSLIEKAIAHESFKVFYQPIRNVHTGRFESAEALVRLIDDEHGFIPPDEFIPLAEESGTIIKIGEIVVKKVCKFLKNHDLEKLGIKYIEVNVSPVQLATDTIVSNLLSIIDGSMVSRKWINFEITETADTDLAEGTVVSENIIKLHEAGIGFSLDDFGSGFASMEYLFRLPVSMVKVDKSILWQAMKDENAKIVLLNTFKMTKELKKLLLVEGVEDEEMVALLEANGCDYMQGYYYSKPLPEEEYVEFLKKS